MWREDKENDEEKKLKKLPFLALPCSVYKIQMFAECSPWFLFNFPPQLVATSFCQIWHKSVNSFKYKNYFQMR